MLYVIALFLYQLSATLERVAFLESSLIELPSKNLPTATDAKMINIDSCDISKNQGGSDWINLKAKASNLSLHETRSTQTTETVFAPCCRCFDTHHALCSAVRIASKQCSKLELHSELALTNWSAQAEEVGRLNLVKWSEAYQLDMESLEKVRLLLEQKMTILVPERDHLKSSICVMEKENQELREQIKSLKVCSYVCNI